MALPIPADKENLAPREYKAKPLCKYMAKPMFLDEPQIDLELESAAAYSPKQAVVKLTPLKKTGDSPHVQTFYTLQQATASSETIVPPLLDPLLLDADHFDYKQCPEEHLSATKELVGRFLLAGVFDDFIKDKCSCRSHSTLSDKDMRIAVVSCVVFLDRNNTLNFLFAVSGNAAAGNYQKFAKSAADKAASVLEEKLSLESFVFTGVSNIKFHIVTELSEFTNTRFCKKPLTPKDGWSDDVKPEQPWYCSEEIALFEFIKLLNEGHIAKYIGIVPIAIEISNITVIDPTSAVHTLAVKFRKTKAEQIERFSSNIVDQCILCKANLPKLRELIIHQGITLSPDSSRRMKSRYGRLFYSMPSAEQKKALKADQQKIKSAAKPDAAFTKTTLMQNEEFERRAKEVQEKYISPLDLAEPLTPKSPSMLFLAPKIDVTASADKNTLSEQVTLSLS